MTYAAILKRSVLRTPERDRDCGTARPGSGTTTTSTGNLFSGDQASSRQLHGGAITIWSPMTTRGCSGLGTARVEQELRPRPFSVWIDEPAAPDTMPLKTSAPGRRVVKTLPIQFSPPAASRCRFSSPMAPARSERTARSRACRSGSASHAADSRAQQGPHQRLYACLGSDPGAVVSGRRSSLPPSVLAVLEADPAARLQPTERPRLAVGAGTEQADQSLRSTSLTN